MASPLLLNGHTLAPDTDSFRAELERVKAQMREWVDGINDQLSEINSRLERIQSGLLVAAGGDATVTGNVEYSPSANPKWEFWKKRFGGRLSDTIDLLLNQREMNATQLCSALRCDPRTLSAKVIYPLNKAGLLNKNGGKFSLKEL